MITPKTHNWSLLLVAALLAGLGWALPAQAQDTRVDAIEDQIADKAKQLQPYEAGRLERTMLFIEENNVIRRLSAKQQGWYPRLGGLTTGSGFALGPGYRKYFQRDGLFEISAAASLKSYRAVEVEFRSPSFADDQLAVGLDLGYRHYPQERFFGLGPASNVANRVSYLYEDTSAVGSLLIAPRSPLRGGVRVGYISTQTGSGAGLFPSIETVFPLGETPGFVEQPDYLFGEGHIELDYRDRPGNPRSGGLHRLSLSTYRDRTADRFSFRRIDAEAMQLIPFLDKRRVIAVRAMMALTDAEDGHDVPFYMMPFVGGPETLRGYRERRFTDRNLLLVNAEYRYEIFAALDMALFFDAGMVAPRIEDLKVSEFKTDYGIGFRFGTRENLILRFDIGLGGEGTRYFLKFGPAF